MTPFPSRSQLEAADTEARADLLDALARAAANGDEAATAELAWAILRFRLARGAIRRYLINDADVDAAEQAALVGVALRIGSWRGEGRFTSWLNQVARNEALQFIRAESRHSKRAEALPPEDLAENFVARVSSMIVDASLVEEAIASLSDNHRNAVLLREEQGLTYDEIADRLDIPLSTAKTWVRRARIELAERLTEALSAQK